MSDTVASGQDAGTVTVDRAAFEELLAAADRASLRLIWIGRGDAVLLTKQPGQYELTEAGASNHENTMTEGKRLRAAFNVVRGASSVA